MVSIKEKVVLFDDKIILETLRQWTELVVGIILILWFAISAYKLRKTLKSWLVLDVVLINILILRVLLFLVFEFLYPCMFLVFMSDNLYLGIVILIFYLFARSAFPSFAHKILNRRTYAWVMIFLLVAQIIYAIIDFDNAFHWKDDQVNSGTEIHNVILKLFEALVGVWNLISTYLVFRELKKREEEKDEKQIQLSEMLNQKDDYKEMKRKLIIIGVGGFLCSIARASTAIISHIFVKNNKNFVWKQNMYYVALNNETDLFLWYELLIGFIPTFLLFYVIYYIPRSSGKITNIRTKGQKVDLDKIDINKAIQDLENEQNYSGNGHFQFDESTNKSKFSSRVWSNGTKDDNSDDEILEDSEPKGRVDQSFNTYMNNTQGKKKKNSKKIVDEDTIVTEVNKRTMIF